MAYLEKLGNVDRAGPFSNMLENVSQLEIARKKHPPQKQRQRRSESQRQSIFRLSLSAEWQTCHAGPMRFRSPNLVSSDWNLDLYPQCVCQEIAYATYYPQVYLTRKTRNLTSSNISRSSKELNSTIKQLPNYLFTFPTRLAINLSGGSSRLYMDKRMASNDPILTKPIDVPLLYLIEPLKTINEYGVIPAIPIEI